MHDIPLARLVALVTVRGAGDRWLAGEPVEGVTFARHAAVRITSGARAEQHGLIHLLIALRPEPQYLVRLPDGSEVRALQSALLPYPGDASSR